MRHIRTSSKPSDKRIRALQRGPATATTLCGEQPTSNDYTRKDAANIVERGHLAEWPICARCLEISATAPIARAR